MAVAQGPFLAAVLLLISSGLHCSSPSPACPEACTCQRAALFNCSSSGLFSVPKHIQDSVTELDLSHNLVSSVTFDRPHHFRDVWLGNNSITHLSLCIERNLGSRYVRGRHLHHLRPWRGRRCVSWAPNLQLLSVERNQLKQLPQGLEGSESLQVLQISFNRISALQPGDLSQLRQLKELHLQHNFITSLHPQIFQDLAQLRVLDLSFNMLTSLHPLMYPSLRNIGADVRLGGNRWQCDCSMLSLRRRLAYDSSRGLQAWCIVCASPSILLGRDLLQLEEDDLNCFGTEHGPELHRDVTVYSGSEILLSCSAQDSVWWTPSGQASLSQPQAGLLINDVTEKDIGLYVCVSKQHKVVSVFDIQISKIEGARRKTRSLPSTSLTYGIGQERNPRATQSDLALAVCLSVFITFLIAFILGVLARPCMDVLWERVTKKKSSSATTSVSSVERRQYDNEAYSNGEEPDFIGTHRERRVTFSTVDFREDSNVQYYDTIANQERIKNDAVIGDSRGENSLQQTSPEDIQRDRDLSGIIDAGRTNNIEIEHIPDPVEVEKRISLSSRSDSSLSDKVLNENQMTRGDHSTYKTHHLAEDSVQLRAESLKVPHFSKESTSELPGSSSEPFADWSPHTNNNSLTDLGQENEEQFEFSDSVCSMSARSSSVCGSLNDSKLNVRPTSDEQKMDDTSSSSSYVSTNEPTQYTVNSDQEEEKDIKRNHNKPKVTSACLQQNASFEQQIHNVDPTRPSVRFNQGDNVYETQKPTVRPEDSFSSHSSDSDGEDYTVKKGHVPSLAVTTHSQSLDTRASSPPAAYSSSSNEAERLSTDLDHQCIPQTQRRVDISAHLPVSESSSSDESMDEKTKHTNKEEQGHVDMTGLQNKEYQFASHDSIKAQWPALDLGHATLINVHLDIRAPSPPTDSSSSSASEDETTGHTERPGKVNVAGLPFQESPSGSYDPQTQWPALDLEHTTRIQRRLDIKAPLPPPDSSSSCESEDETTGHTERPGKVNVAGLPFQESPCGSYDPETQWPALDLEHTTRIQRRLDIKAPSPPTDSTSSSDSEDETTNHLMKQKQGQMNMARIPSKVSITGSYDPQTQWPVLDLERTIGIKRRLDLKAPSPPTDLSSSSDSEDETTGHTERPREVNVAGLPFQESQTGSYDPETQWPALDLEHTTRIKRRLDIKAPSPPTESSSSSDSEDETTNHIIKQGQGQMNMARIPSTVSQTGSYDPETQWPALDLEHTTRIKRRLDIKAPSPESNSSSSSDSEDETTHHIKKQEQGETHMARLPSKISQTGSYDPETQWPALDLEHTTRIKRRLDIKAPSPPTDSSSSSDSEDETTNHIMEREQGQMNMARIPNKEPQTGNYDPRTQWPALDLEHTMRIKRRLDIKAPSPESNSSSSSDSEGETHHSKKMEQRETHMARLPSKVSQSGNDDPQRQWPVLDLKRTTRIKRRLDIKPLSGPTDSSSSSDSENETTNNTMKQEQGQMNMAKIPSKVSQTGSYDPQTQWPLLDLEHTKHIKRRLDIKAPSLPTVSSSSTDSEDETTGHTERPEKVNGAGLPFHKSQTGNYDTQTQWPALNLEHTMRIKRRLDIKAPLPPPDSSSSCDSEDETTGHTEMQRPGKVDTAKLPFQESQTKSVDPDIMWPALDLEQTTRIQRRLDIKAPSPPTDSTSSSDSEDETTNHLMKQKQGQMNMARIPSTVSQTGSYDPETQWPALDLEHTTRIKRRLDIKAPSPPTVSSSSSDSEDETIGHTERPEKVNGAGLPFHESQTGSYDPQTQWPALNLEHTMRIKRRLDIKAPSPESNSSSSSDSENETTHHIKKQEQGETHMARLSSKISQTGSYDPETQWPALDLEHTTRIKRRLDIKPPSGPTDSSSSSDSEDETTNHIIKQGQGQMNIARSPSKVSQTGNYDPQTQLPTLNLEHTTRIKRRLDIKAPLPKSNSFSSSESEGESTQHTERPGKVKIAGFPFHESQTEINDPDMKWPTLDLEHTMRIKRRLDIKARSPPIDSSSSSDSNDEKTKYTEKQKQGEMSIPRLSSKVSQTGSYDPQTQWPAINLERTTRIKRRLDIKAPSPPTDSSSSSDSEDETTNHIMKQEQGQMDMARIPSKVSQTANHDPQTQWPALDLEHTMRIKRHLDIKAPSPKYNSSTSSDSEDETTHHTEGPGKVNVAGLPFPGNVGITSYQTGTKLPDMNVSVPPVKRRLNIKGPPLQSDPVLSSVSPGSQGSESNSSRSDSEDEYAKLGLGASAISENTEKELIRSPKTPVTKTDHNIKLEKYTVITDEVRDKTTSDKISTTPEINPELQSRWATMNLGISRFRKRLEITSHTHESPKLPSSLPPDSPSSSSSESGTRSKSRRRQEIRGDGMQGIIQTESSLNKPVNDSLSLKGRNDNSVEVKFRNNYSLPTTEEKSNPDTMLTGFGSPHLKRYLDIKVSEKAPATPPPLRQMPDSSSNSENEDASPEHAGKGWSGRSKLPVVTDKEASQKDFRAPLQRESSSNSNSEDKTVDRSVPDLSLGVPHVKRRLNVKALPEHSYFPSSRSEGENEVTGYTANQSRHESSMSRMTDNDDLITYKRLIIKPSSPPSNSFTPSGKSPFHSVGDRNESLAPKTVPSMSFDDVVEKRIEQPRHTTNMDLPPEIRWTGVGHQSDLSIPGLSRHLDVGFSSPHQVRGNTDVTLMQKHSSLSANRVSLAPSRTLDKLDNPPRSTNEMLRAVTENSNQRKGLSALKAMSSERRRWEILDTNVDTGASPLFDDHGPQVDTSFNYRKSEKDIKPLAKQPPTQLHPSSTSVDERRATDLLYGIPHYRRHDFGGPPQEAPPPIPATPPPYEAVGLTWKSPQSSMEQGLEGTRSHLQRSGNTESSDPSSLTSQNLAVDFDFSDFNISEV